MLRRLWNVQEEGAHDSGNESQQGQAVKTAGEEKAQAQTALNLASDKLTSLKNLKQTTPSLVPDIDLKTAQGAEADARSPRAATP